MTLRVHKCTIRPINQARVDIMKGGLYDIMLDEYEQEIEDNLEDAKAIPNLSLM